MFSKATLVRCIGIISRSTMFSTPARSSVRLEVYQSMSLLFQFHSLTTNSIPLKVGSKSQAFHIFTSTASHCNLNSLSIPFSIFVSIRRSEFEPIAHKLDPFSPCSPSTSSFTTDSTFNPNQNILFFPIYLDTIIDLPLHPLL